MKIGLICEGITDYIVIENIICGYLGIDDDNINQLQPVLDETSQKQASHSFGGWENVLTYLQATDFIDAADNHDYLIIQIDTDECEHKNFGVKPISLATNNPEDFYRLIKNRLIEKINEKFPTNFQQYSEKLIFCISIHSLECWLLVHYQKKQPTTHKIVRCAQALEYIFDVQPLTVNRKMVPYEKNYRCYDAISQPFLNIDNIEKTCKESLSFRLFIERLNQVKAVELLLSITK